MGTGKGTGEHRQHGSKQCENSILGGLVHTQRQMFHTAYYAAHYYSSRCYAREYLNLISDYDPDLMNAASLYAQVADQRRLLWVEAPDTIKPGRQLLDDFVTRLNNAKNLEAEAHQARKGGPRAGSPRAGNPRAGNPRAGSPRAGGDIRDRG